MSGNLLAKWIIGKAEKSEAYRAGTLKGMKHPKPDREMIKAAGGLPELIRQADELEKSGYIRTEKSNLGADFFIAAGAVITVMTKLFRPGSKKKKKAKTKSV